MDTTVIAVIVGTLVVVVVGAVILRRQGHPEETATHDTRDESAVEGPVDGDYPPGSRPAGPGAESMEPPASSPDEPPGNRPED